MLIYNIEFLSYMGRPIGPIGLTRAVVSWTGLGWASAGSDWPFLDPSWPIGRLGVYCMFFLVSRILALICMGFGAKLSRY